MPVRPGTDADAAAAAGLPRRPLTPALAALT